MAKTRTSRRERRLENLKESANGTAVTSTIAEKPMETTPMRVNGLKPAFKFNEAAQAVDLTTEYFYVYTEVRNILIVTAAMLVVLFGLSRFI